MADRPSRLWTFQMRVAARPLASGLILFVSTGAGFSQDDPRLADLRKFLDVRNIERLINEYPDISDVVESYENGDPNAIGADVATKISEFVRRHCPPHPNIQILARGSRFNVPEDFAVARIKDHDRHAQEPCNPVIHEVETLTSRAFEKLRRKVSQKQADPLELDHYWNQKASRNTRFVTYVHVNDFGEVNRITAVKLRRNKTFIGRAFTLLSRSTNADWRQDILFSYDLPTGRGEWIEFQ